MVMLNILRFANSVLITRGDAGSLQQLLEQWVKNKILH